MREGCHAERVSVAWFYKWRGRLGTSGPESLIDGRRRVEADRKKWIKRMLVVGASKLSIRDGARVSLSTVYRISRETEAEFLAAVRARSYKEETVAASVAAQNEFELTCATIQGTNKLTKGAAKLRRRLIEENIGEVEELLWSCTVQIATTPPTKWWEPSNQLLGLPRQVATDGKFDWLETPRDLALMALRIGKPQYPYGGKRWWTAQIWLRDGSRKEELYANVPSAYVELRSRLRARQLSDRLRPWELSLVAAGEPTRVLRSLLGEKLAARAVSLQQSDDARAAEVQPEATTTDDPF